MATEVLAIHAGTVALRSAGGHTQQLPNDAVIICAGGQLPTPLLKDIGIRFETRHGAA
jgi:thioredoxin reductase (NADPH)